MANLSEIYIKTETLQTLLDTAKKKDMKGISITIGINDQTNEWGQNVVAYISQTKEQRDSKKDRYYVGNGKVFWTDGKITLAEKKEKQANETPPVVQDNNSNDEDALPF